MYKVNQMIALHNNLTNDNNHGAALQLLASETNQPAAAKIIEHINAICTLAGHLPHELNQYRETVRKEVEAKARKLLGDAKFAELK